MNDKFFVRRITNAFALFCIKMYFYFSPAAPIQRFEKWNLLLGFTFATILIFSNLYVMNTRIIFQIIRTFQYI